MRVALIVVNLFVAAASTALFAYTFFARDHLIRLTQDYVIDKTVHFVMPAIDETEAALKKPQALFIPAGIRDAIQAEVDSFRRNSNAYVRSLVVSGAAIEKPILPFADQMIKWKESILSYYDKTLTSLIRDLRIFAGTNVVAGLLAAWMASLARGRWRWRILSVSVLLLISLGLQAYLFIDNLGFWHIITNARMGWSYPLFMLVTFVYLFWKLGRFVPLAPSASPTDSMLAASRRRA